jgi:hypothetical protein
MSELNETPAPAPTVAPDAGTAASTGAPSNAEANDASIPNRGGRGRGGRGRGRGTANGRKHKNMGRNEYKSVIPPPSYSGYPLKHCLTAATKTRTTARSA